MAQITRAFESWMATSSAGDGPDFNGLVAQIYGE
jgi:hypothetical protein